MMLLAKYNTQLVVPFALYTLDGQALQKGAAHAAGDTVLMKDEGVEANTTNGFVDEGSGYSITLTATEMQAARLLLLIEDQTAPKAWLSRAVPILTFGHASAHLAFDLSQATPAVNVTQISSVQAAAVAQSAAAQGVVVAAVTAAISPTASSFSTTLAGGDGRYFNRTLVWLPTAALAGEAARIVRYEVTNGRVYVTPMSGAPSNADGFIIV